MKLVGFLITILLVFTGKPDDVGNFQISDKCSVYLEVCFNELTYTLIYDPEFCEWADNYFCQWDSKTNYDTSFDDFLESLKSDPVMPEAHFINITIDTIFKGAFKPSLGDPYQYIGFDIEREVENGTKMEHSISHQIIDSRDDILTITNCEIDSFGKIDNKIIFGSQSKKRFVNVLVSDYYKNNKYACFEIAMIPSRRPEVIQNKINFEGYYFTITFFIDLKTEQVAFRTVGTVQMMDKYSATNRLAVFKE